MSRTTRFAVTLVVSVSSAVLTAATVAERARADDALVVHTHYDGVTNDLLTAGLGALGLQSATAPGVADPLHPTVEELRRLAIYNNYRALVDISTGGGFTVLYGPNVKPDGTAQDPSTHKGLIAGDEYLAFEKADDGRAHVTIMVQIPDSFDPTNSCLVAAPSSGSRGVYGAIATAGEWGLKHGCAVAYTDKGTGTGAHDLQNNTVNLMQGQRADAAQAGDDSNFTANLSDSQRAAFNAATPNRFAFKHAHSQQNPEEDWGKNVLRSIKFAFSLLNEKFRGGGIEITKRNTIVIASSVSNGGGASALAVEQDEDHLIDGLAVGEPNVNPKFSSEFTIVQGGGPAFAAHSRPLIDYITLVNVFQGCADLANPTAPFNFAASPQRCANLHAKGLLTSTTQTAQAAEAQKIINDFGILPEQNIVQPVLWFAYVPQAIAVTYANAYGRFSVLDNLCNYSFAGTAGVLPAPLAPSVEATIFSTSNGIPPTAGLDLAHGVNLINNAAPGGAKEDRASTLDQNLDGALCLRSLATGKDAVTGTPLAGTAKDQAHRIAESVEDILASGNLHRTPAIFVTGRSDGILPPNFASRAYFGLNHVVEGSLSPLHYYEVTNAQHLDDINALPGFDTIYIPLLRYFVQAMDLMYDHLRHGRALPPSQVVHTVPRGGTPGAAPQITLSNVPPIADAPSSSVLITFTSGQVNIPN
jgi:hydroxybutyrate-dimer hydrolase